MLPVTSPRKKLKSPLADVSNPKSSVTCTNVPEGLFDQTAAKKHFGKFGRLQKIKLFPKKSVCIVEYDQPLAAERAVLNAGAFDGFMFDVTRTKPRIRKKSKREDDPDWVPDSDVEEELSAMRGAPTYRMSRQKPMDLEPVVTPKLKSMSRTIKQSPIKKTIAVPRNFPILNQPASGRESPIPVTVTQTSMSTFEAAAELHQLRYKTSIGADEQWRILDARDRILRAWGGAGSRVKVGGATIGTCQDMCPEKELLHRQAEHQVMTLETYIDSDGQLEPWRAVKQYSRSSADQEMPMCYELRPAAVLMRTCSYLLHEIADTTRQVTLSDWFHFMWDRLRSIRKDITQQALCCAESICLVEICARFHAHCAARLADLEHTQFDQKLNTDNLTKCLQTLKHMYADVTAHQRPREAEFRGYIALLNLGDANFWWEIKQLPQDIQKSEPIIFAIQIFNALDNNNYVKFFRMVKERATYLQACILLRYFNDVRARALARIVKAFAPRGGSRYPASDLMNALAFESIESMKSFINHYGLRFAKVDEYELSVILDRNHFIEDSDPFPIARAMKLIESKRQSTVGEVIAGGTLPTADYSNHLLYTSFTRDGKLKETALIAEDQGFNTLNDSNKDTQALKVELQRLAQGGKSYTNIDLEPKASLFVKPDIKMPSPKPKSFVAPPPVTQESNLFLFKPAIQIAPVDVIKNSPDKMFEADAKNAFSFSKPQESNANLFLGTNKNSLPRPIFGAKPTESKNIFEKPETESIFQNKASETKNLFEVPESKTIFDVKAPDTKGLFQTQTSEIKTNIFESKASESKNLFKTSESKSVFGGGANLEQKNLFGTKANNPFQNADSVFGGAKSNDLFNKKPQTEPSLFSKPVETKQSDDKNLFTIKSTTFENKNSSDNVFSNAKSSVFTRLDNTKFDKGNIFARANEDDNKQAKNLFGSFSKEPENKSIFGQSETIDHNKPQSIFTTNGEVPSTKLSPGSLFKSVLQPQNGPDSSNTFFQPKTKAQTVADNILTSVNTQHENDIYNFENNDDIERQIALKEQQIKEEQIRLQEKIRQEEDKVREQLRLQEQKRKEEEERRKQEELRILEEKRKKEEERKQEELKKRLEAERLAEFKRRAEEAKAKFKAAVEKESTLLTEELVDEVVHETTKELIQDEQESLRQTIGHAKDITEELTIELCNEICEVEMKAEMYLTRSIMKKWFYIWRNQFIRNLNRRKMLEDTPVWLPDRTPIEEAARLRRAVEGFALKNMNAIHKGYKFTGELNQIPAPDPYNIMDIIRSPLLKRMKEISYPYDKCFFWKVTIVAPSESTWLCRKINILKWILDAFSDNMKHNESETLIQVGKQSWNSLMDFAISVSLITKENMAACAAEAVEGTNAVLFYSDGNKDELIESIEQTLKHKYPYQVVPVTVVTSKIDEAKYRDIQTFLTGCVQKKNISEFKILVVDSHNVSKLLNAATKSALRWMAKKFPKIPPLEIDYLKSICQRYLGNDIWWLFRAERDNRMSYVIKDMQKLITCYNTAVKRLTDVITNEDLFNYTSFPLEFKVYLDHSLPHPKPYEFIPSSVRSSENISVIRDLMKQLMLPMPCSEFNPLSVTGMQKQIRTYCNQIGWFEDPEEVVCKVVAVLPNELSDINMPTENFTQYFTKYDLIDFLNIIVYEKINKLKNFNNRFAVYEKSVLQEYCKINWIYDVNVVSEMKHKAINFEDDLDYLIEAKRRRIAFDSLEYLELEDKDSTLVEENIKNTESDITMYNGCSEAVKQLEKELEEGKKKSIEFENMLKAALADV